MDKVSILNNIHFVKKSQKELSKKSTNLSFKFKGQFENLKLLKGDGNDQTLKHLEGIILVNFTNTDNTQKIVNSFFVKMNL